VAIAISELPVTSQTIEYEKLSGPPSAALVGVDVCVCVGVDVCDSACGVLVSVGAVASVGLAPAETVD
jgi:hypothetical protein